MLVKICGNEFDQLFSEILVNSPEDTEQTPLLQERKQQKVLCAERIDEKIKIAMILFQKGKYAKTLSTLRPVEEYADQYPLMQALLGATRAIVLGEVKDGINTCLIAIKQAFYVAEIYYVLSKALLRAGFRAKAYVVVKRGLRIDPDNRFLARLLHEMGKRKRPMLPFLPRAHPANRFLGRVRARISAS